MKLPLSGHRVFHVARTFSFVLTKSFPTHYPHRLG